MRERGNLMTIIKEEIIMIKKIITDRITGQILVGIANQGRVEAEVMRNLELLIELENNRHQNTLMDNQLKK